MKIQLATYTMDTFDKVNCEIEIKVTSTNVVIADEFIEFIRTKGRDAGLIKGGSSIVRDVKEINAKDIK